ncbi:hypothetical protein NPIL_123251 [Nephila pilipes]|uniref:Uncharacterized protein n=1 Tax=Nephila pilipes TaxID=299642 RepID=A0A8X6I2Z9_NEPPI|nr:hypothetical protein NPIL_123251 [Nephila pilipes]
MDAFPTSPSSTVLPVYLPDKADAMEHVPRNGMVKSFIIYQELKNKRIFVSFSSPTWFQKKVFMDNFKLTISETQVENQFDPEAVQWDKISQTLLRNPDPTLKNVDKRIGFNYNTMFIVVLFHLWTEKGGTGHSPPDSEFPCSSTSCYRPVVGVRRNPTCIGGTLPSDAIPSDPIGTRYQLSHPPHSILMTIQKTVGYGARNRLTDAKWLSISERHSSITTRFLRVHQRIHLPRSALGKRSLSKNPFEVTSRYKKMRITPATRRIKRPPTAATTVFVLQLVHPSPPIPVVVAHPAPVAVFPPAPVFVSPAAPVLTLFFQNPPPETISPVRTPSLPEPYLMENQAND